MKITQIETGILPIPPNETTKKENMTEEMMFDLDGHSKLSNIVLIRGDKLNVLQVQGLYPNPATSQINLLLSSPIQEKMQLQLMDITGRTIVQRWISVETGSNNIPVNISMLSSGSYLVKLLGASSQETIVAKFVKQ